MLHGQQAQLQPTIGVFGSMARREAKKQSDIDQIVCISKRSSVLAVVRLERKADVLTEAALSPYLRERILKEMRVVYRPSSAFAC